MVDVNTKAAEFRTNAEACGLEATRGPQMDAYVSNGINGDGTSKHTNGPIMSSKEAFCMKIPGSVDERTSADRLKDWLKTSFSAAEKAVGRSLEDAAALGRDVQSNAQRILADPSGAIKDGQAAYNASVVDRRINTAVDGPMNFK